MTRHLGERKKFLARQIWIPLTLAALLLGGCEKKPEGQVVAIVNGDEITQGEVNEELKITRLPKGVDEAKVRQAVVNSLVDRRILVAAAREDGIDKDPNFLIQRKQREDRLLVQLLAQRAARSMSKPAVGEVNAYMNANPGSFADRVLWRVNRLEFAAPKDPAVLKAIEGDHSMDAIIARLRSAGIEFSQATATLDSASVPQNIYATIASLPAGEPFLQTKNGVVTVAAVLGKEPAPISGDPARAAAADRLLGQRVNSRLNERLKALKAAAKIQYQAGYAPPK